MGLFSRSKKSPPAQAPASSSQVVKVEPGMIRTLSKHPTGFYKHALKDKNGIPHATRMYWNSHPPTPCPEIQQTSVFDADMHDVERFDTRDSREQFRKEKTHVFNRVYDSKGDSRDTVRSVGTIPDYRLIRSWLMQCDKEHQQCRVDGNVEKLKIITLIDVRNSRLVRYKPGMQYVALSYVWGGVASLKRTRPSELPANVSKTIQHAMVVADKIGFPLLWADAVCIDQDDLEEKARQLPIMDYIYEHACVTIVALGDNANTGLPGVEDGPPRYWQLVVEFGPVKLMSRCPTLLSQIRSSQWSTRGWTYQEGLFSRRCIFFSQHQVYFHCNAMLCTEDTSSAIYFSRSLNSKQSTPSNGYWHNDKKYIQLNSLSNMKTHPSAQAIGNIQLFTSYLNEYVSREISYDEDAIAAFGALLARLKRDHFPSGFVHGIPKDAFRDGLLWTSWGTVLRRQKSGFPSWSWAAWKSLNRSGGTHYSPLTLGWPSYHSIPPPLHISLGEERLHTSPTTKTRFSGLALEIQDLWNAYRARDPRPFLAKMNPSLPVSNSLYIDGPIVTLPVTYDFPTQVIGFELPAYLVPRVRIDKGWPPPPFPKGVPSRQDFLVMETKYVDRGSLPSQIIFTFMMLQWEGPRVANRAGILRFAVESGLEVFWKFSGVRRGALWLI